MGLESLLVGLGSFVALLIIFLMSLYNLSYVLMKDRLLTKKNVCLSCPWIDISKQLNILENASLSKLCNGTNSLFWHEICSYVLLFNIYIR